jgi:sensor histidine kinase regulating citrate/malate metabolism
MKALWIIVIIILGLGFLALGFIFVSDFFKAQQLQYQAELAAIASNNQSSFLGAISSVAGGIIGLL